MDADGSVGESDKKGGAAVGGSLGVVGLLAVVAIVFYCRRRKQLHGFMLPLPEDDAAAGGSKAYTRSGGSSGGVNAQHKDSSSRSDHFGGLQSAPAADTFVNPNFSLDGISRPPTPPLRTRNRTDTGASLAPLSLEAEILAYTSSPHGSIRSGTGAGVPAFEEFSTAESISEGLRVFQEGLPVTPDEGFSPPDHVRKDRLPAAPLDGYETFRSVLPATHAASAAINNYGRMAVSKPSGDGYSRAAPHHRVSVRLKNLQARKALRVLGESAMFSKQPFWRRTDTGQGQGGDAMGAKHSRAILTTFTLDDGESNDSNNRRMSQAANDPFVINIDDLLVDDKGVLGKGHYGLVRRGTLRGNNDVVAVKTLPVDREHAREEQHDLMMEIETLRVLTVDGGHANVIALIGYIPSASPIMVTECAEYGSLDKYLRKKRKADPPEALGDVTTVTYAYQIAAGMEYIASKKMVHRDLASRNILLADTIYHGEEKHCKITDFGLARDMYASADGMYTSRPDGNPTAWKWTAIEGLTDAQFTTEGDVWSYGVTLTELCSLAMSPYMQYRAFSMEFFNELSDGMRMAMRTEWPLSLRQIIPACWEAAPLKRPTFTAIVKTLQGALNELGVAVGHNVARRLSAQELSDIERANAQPDGTRSFYEYVLQSPEVSETPTSPGMFIFAPDVVEAQQQQAASGGTASTGMMIMQRSASEDSAASSTLIPRGTVGHGTDGQAGAGSAPAIKYDAVRSYNVNGKPGFVADGGGGTGQDVHRYSIPAPASATASTAARYDSYRGEPEHFANLGTPLRRSVSQDMPPMSPGSLLTPAADYGSECGTDAEASPVHINRHVGRTQSMMSTTSNFERTKSTYSLASRGGPVAISADADVDFETAVNAAAAAAQASQGRSSAGGVTRGHGGYDLAGRPIKYDLAGQQQQQQQQQHGGVPYDRADQGSQQDQQRYGGGGGMVPYDLAGQQGLDGGGGGVLLLAPPPMFQDTEGVEQASMMHVVSDSAC